MMNTEVVDKYLSDEEPTVWITIEDDGECGDSDILMSSESESESEPEMESESDSDSDSEVVGGVRKIYPGPDLGNYCYRHAHVLDFSKRSIANYNRDTGHGYEFVELVTAYVNQAWETDFFTAIFKARQPDDLSVTSFRAETYAPSRSLLDPNLDIKVVPLHSESDTSSTSTSTSGSESGLDSEDKLKTRVGLLQISS